MFFSCSGFQVASQYCGNYDRKQSDTTIVPHTLQEKLSKMDECQAFESFSVNYANCGLFGMYYVCKGLHIWDVLCICKETQKFWKHLAFSAVDAEIDWAKYGLKTRLFKELENNTNLASHVATEVCFFCLNRIQLKLGSTDSHNSSPLDIIPIFKAQIYQIFEFAPKAPFRQVLSIFPG